MLVHTNWVQQIDVDDSIMHILPLESWYGQTFRKEVWLVITNAKAITWLRYRYLFLGCRCTYD